MLSVLAFSLAWTPSLRPMRRVGNWDEAPAQACNQALRRGHLLTPSPKNVQ